MPSGPGEELPQINAQDMVYFHSASRRPYLAEY